MKYLLDSCIIIWWLVEPAKLSKKMRSVISDINNEIYLSSASVWELSIKHKLGKINLPHNFLEVIHKQRIYLLEISAEHALATSDLPLIHQDPFDRMLIAQAKCENLILITRDEVICSYPITTVSA